MKIAIAWSLMLLLPAVVWAQRSSSDTSKPVVQSNISLSGKIIDANTQKPIEGALVHIKGTTHEVTTNEGGAFFS
jgi:hypothetical protein